MAAESEVSFSDDLDGSTIRVGVLRTRWNDEHVSNLVDGIKVSLFTFYYRYFYYCDKGNISYIIFANV